METKIDTAKQNSTKGCTPKQAGMLRGLGFAGDVTALTKSAAKDMIDRMIAARNAWREQAKAAAANIDLIELAGRYTQLRRESSREYSGACPRCGGGKRFHVKADSWFCRDCHPAWGDAIEFIRWMENCSFDDALERLTNGSAPAPVRIATATTDDQPADRDAWRRKALLILANAQERLYTTSGKAGLDYLLNRGLTLSTIRLFGLGYVTEASLPGTWNADEKTFSHPRQPAILIPWYADNELVAIRYRFLQAHTYMDTDNRERTEKQSAMYGSDFLGKCWGGQSVRMDRAGRTLIVTEGEINAMSLFQVGSDAGIDVISTGSESTTKHLPDAVVELSKGYQYRLVWADKQEIATDAALQIDAAAMTSPPWKDAQGNQLYHADGKPKSKDANDLLKEGKLGALLAAMLKKAGAELPVHKRVYKQVYEQVYEQPTEQPAPVQPIEQPLATLPPMRYPTDKPPLPPELWLNGLTPAAALAAHARLKQTYFCSCGKDETGWFVRCEPEKYTLIPEASMTYTFYPADKE